MMGNYVNPGSGGFSRIWNDIYVDKTGLIGLLNQTIDTSRCLTCISRPCRFGKSFAAKMLCAYYDKTCNSADLFDDLEIAQDTQYQKYMNRYDVILNILAARNHHSGILETGVPDTETSIDWLDYPASEMEFLSSPKPLAVR